MWYRTFTAFLCFSLYSYVIITDLLIITDSPVVISYQLISVFCRKLVLFYLDIISYLQHVIHLYSPRPGFSVREWEHRVRNREGCQKIFLGYRWLRI